MGEQKYLVLEYDLLQKKNTGGTVWISTIVLLILTILKYLLYYLFPDNVEVYVVELGKSSVMLEIQVISSEHSLSEHKNVMEILDDWYGP